MQYCYYRHGAFPFLGRATVNYIIQVTTSAMRHPQLKRFLSSAPLPIQSPSAIHKKGETECNTYCVEDREVAELGGGHLLERAGARCSVRKNRPSESD